MLLRTAALLSLAVVYSSSAMATAECPSGYYAASTQTVSGSGSGTSCEAGVNDALGDFQSNLGDFSDACCVGCDPGECFAVVDSRTYAPGYRQCDENSPGQFSHSVQADVACCKELPPPGTCTESPFLTPMTCIGQAPNYCGGYSSWCRVPLGGVGSGNVCCWSF